MNYLLKIHKTNRNLLLVLLTSLIFSQCQTSSEIASYEQLPDELNSSINKRIAKGIIPGISIAIIDSSGIQYYNFGLTSKRGKEVDEHSIYEIGSISKVFTAILLAQQVVDGDLTLDDRINDYLPPEVKVPVMGDREITFGNLSDHTSGLPRMPYNFYPANRHNPFADYTLDQMYEFISDYRPVREVGEEFEYSNIAQGLLGHLLAMNKHTTYEDLMIQTIANPLAMNETKIKLDKRMANNLALGHDDGHVVENWDIPTLAGAGAIRSSCADMAKFVSANLGYTESPLRAAMEFSHQIRHDKAGNMRVALGWLINKGEDGDIILHGGATGGYRTFIGFVKETGKGVVLLTNSSAGADDIGFYLLDSGSKLSEVRSENDAVKIPKAILEQYVGKYELQADLTITITRDGSQLYGQATGQGRFEMFPKNDTLFYLTVADAEISFSINNGLVESLTLFQDGQESQGKKIE